MSHLAPCTGCGRHVNNDEPACPFCGDEIIGSGAPQMPGRRLGRAALFAFGVAAAGAMGATGCSSSNLPEGDAAVDAGVDAGGGVDSGGAVPPYGTPPEDGGGPMPLYGGAPGD